MSWRNPVNEEEWQHVLLLTRQSYQRTKKKRAISIAAWRAKNPDKLKLATKNWRTKNLHKIRAYCANRRAKRLGAIHLGHDKAKDPLFYAEAKRLTRETGIRHEVDHIIPLASGGHHHHDNLQILPRFINIAKRANPFWEQAPYKCWRDVPEHLWPESLADEYNALKYGIAI